MVLSMSEYPDIHRIGFYSLVVPLKSPFNIATSEVDVIENIAVTIELSDGSMGWGEIPIMPAVTAESQEVAKDILTEESKLLVGRHADWQIIAKELQDRYTAYPATRGGLEMALIDALSRSSQVPLYQFFGGASDHVMTDITIPICSAEEAGRLAQSYKDQGFSIVKTKVGKSITADMERIFAIKRGFEDCQLILDANTGYTVEETLEVLDALRQANIVPDLLEQPLAREEWEGMGLLARETEVPIAADESCCSVEDALRIVDGQLAQVINIKLAKSGVSEALKIVDIARANDIGLMVGGMVETRLAMGFSAHFAAGLGGFDWIDLDTPILLAEDPVSGGYVAEGPIYKLDTGQYGHGGELRGMLSTRGGR